MGLSIDRERVIRGTEICLSGGLPQRCIECPYHHDGCDRQRMIDTLKLLNEQEAKTILDIADSIEGIEVGKCPRCEMTSHPLMEKEFEITYVLSGWGIENGYCVFGIKPIRR